MARTNRSPAAAASTVLKDRAERPAPKIEGVPKVAKVVALPGRGAPPQSLTLDVARVTAVKNGTVSVTMSRLGAEPRVARSVVDPGNLAVGDQVIVAPIGGADADPLTDLVILGRLHDPLAAPRDVRINGRKVSVEADAELVLKCAAATIRIGRNGLIAVRGDQVVTQARGANRIRGGSVEIN